MIGRVVLLGAGNLAWHLGPALVAAGVEVVQVWSRSEARARALGVRLGAEWADGTQNPTNDGETVFFALPDGAIADTARRLGDDDGRLWLHASGSVPLAALAHRGGPWGVWYALQSFSVGRVLTFSEIPVFIEASDVETQVKLFGLAHKTGNPAQAMNSSTRLQMHLAAVFANNFANHMWDIAAQLCVEQGINPKVLEPLMHETLAKALDLGPHRAQTGPARRDDTATLTHHVALLKHRPLWQKIYTFVSEGIRAFFLEK